MPYVFTEQGVAMLSTVLNTEIAIQVSIQIMQAFVAMWKTMGQQANSVLVVERPAPTFSVGETINDWAVYSLQ